MATIPAIKSNKRALARRLPQVALLATTTVVGAPVWGASGETELISTARFTNLAVGESFEPAVNGDGRYVAFVSAASSSALVGGPNLHGNQLYLRDRSTSQTVLAGVPQDGSPPDGANFSPDLSANGRFVSFMSDSTNLVPGDVNGQPDIFVWDRQTGSSELVTVSSNEVQADTGSNGTWSFISDDGRFVAFTSSATNLVPNDTNGTPDAFVRDRQLGTTHRVSVDSSGGQSDGFSGATGISANGRYVAFTSSSPDLVPGDDNDDDDVFVHDRQTGETELVSVATGGAEGNDGSFNGVVSGDGRYVAFVSQARNLVAGDTNGRPDVFVRDRLLGTTVRVSVSSTGTQLNDVIGDFVSISDDGRYVGFQSEASNLVQGDTNGVGDSFVHDLQTGMTERVSVSSNGAQGDALSGIPKLSADGRFVVFPTDASLASNDLNGGTPTTHPLDVYIRDRNPPAPAFAFTLKPAALYFGERAVGTSRTLDLWLKNKGTTALPIASISLRGVDRAMFKFIRSCGASVPVGGECRIRVTFTPTSIGEKSAELRVVAGEDSVRKRPLTGTGAR